MVVYIFFKLINIFLCFLKHSVYDLVHINSKLDMMYKQINHYIPEHLIGKDFFYVYLIFLLLFIYYKTF